MKSRTTHSLLLTAGLAAFLLLTEWNWFAAPFERDEGEYAYAAWIMHQGGVPYRDAFLQKPPATVYTYWLAQRLSDSAVWAPRVLAVCFVMLTIGVVWWIARRQYGTRCAWIGAWLFVPMLALPSLVPIAANTEKFMNLPMMITVALHLHGRERRNPWIWAAAGASASLALLYKPICLLVLLFVCAVWLVETWRQARAWRDPLRQVCWTLLGGALVAFLALGYFFIHGACGALWEATVLFNKSYAAFYGWSADAALRQWAGFVQWWWPLLLAAMWFLYDMPPRCWYFGGLFLLAVFSAYKDPNGHYYIMLLPFWALIAGRGLDGCAVWLGRLRTPGTASLPFQNSVLAHSGGGSASLSLSKGRPDGSATEDPFSAGGWTLWLTIATLLVISLPLLPGMTLSPDNLVEWAYRGNPFAESPLVAQRLAQLTQPGDRVFVAGSEPQLLFYAKRFSVSRFVILYPLMLPTAYAERYQQELVRTLRENPPETVVVSTSPFSWLVQPATPPLFPSYWQDLLRTRYHPVGGFVRKEGRGFWQEPLEYLDQESASLILYQRNEILKASRTTSDARPGLTARLLPTS